MQEIQRYKLALSEWRFAPRAVFNGVAEFHFLPEPE